MGVHSKQSSTPSHALTVDSLRGPDVLLAATFTHHSIGWFFFQMGRLRIRRGAAVAFHRKTPHNTSFKKKHAEGQYCFCGNIADQSRIIEYGCSWGYKQGDGR